MRMIVGLGNPGETYQGTRHNVGFQVLDYLAHEHRLSFRESTWQAQTVMADLGGEAVLLVRPETFMNESGRAVSQIAAHYQVAPQDIIVIHDDLDLELARIKVVVNRGAGGHRGILSLLTHLQSGEFVRIRIGIGRPGPGLPISSYVLTRFRPEEQDALQQQMATVHAAIRLILTKGPLAAMAMVNSSKGPDPG